MTNREVLELQTRLDSLAKLSEEIAALTHSSQLTANKFRAFARYARNIATCVRLHGAIPTERPAPPLVDMAVNLQKLANIMPAAARSIRRTIR